MKKFLALVMAAVMLSAVPASLAEQGQIAPLYATVGEALEDEAESSVIAGGVPGEYYAVVTKKDGKYYRSVAYYDEMMTELEEAVQNVDYEAEDFSEKLEAATAAADEYRKTLPIVYSEEFIAQPLTNEEMESRLGKTLSQLTDEGFEIGSTDVYSNEEGDIIIVYTLRYGVYDYSCTVDADTDAYDTAQENGTEGDLAVKDMALTGITDWGFLKRFHTDGTVEEPEDPFAAMNGVMEAIGELAERAEAGEEIDMEAFAETLKAEYPDYADMIDMFITMYQLYGAEGLSSVAAPAE